MILLVVISPGVLIPELATFHDIQKGVGGLVIEGCAALESLKSNHVGKRGGLCGSFRSVL